VAHLHLAFADAQKLHELLPLYEDGPGSGTWNFNRYQLPRAIVVSAPGGQMQDSVAVYDRDARLVYVNAASERLMERPRADLLGRSLWDAFPDEGSATVRERTGKRNIFRLAKREDVEAGPVADATGGAAQAMPNATPRNGRSVAVGR